MDLVHKTAAHWHWQNVSRIKFDALLCIFT